MSVFDIKRLAERRLRPYIWKYISYTSAAGVSYAKSIPQAFDRWRLRPRILRGTEASTAVTLFGRQLSSPLLVAPTAFHGLYCRGGEAATAFGAAAAGVGYCYNFALSHVGAADVNAASSAGAARNAGPKVVHSRRGVRWAHVYIWKDREYVRWTLREAERLQFDAVIVTADHPHDRVKTMTMPLFSPHEDEPVHPPETAASSRKAPSHCDMRLGETLRDVMRFRNLERYRNTKNDSSDADSRGGAAGENDGRLTFRDLAWVCENTSLPVVCKGVLSPEDAVLAVEAGCSGICVSNHGGRQCDRTLPAIDALPAIVSTLKDRGMHDTVVLVDSGFRTGTQILVALALGASGVLLGRPALWGLAAGGAEGLEYVFRRLSQDLESDMQSVGVASVSELRERGRDAKNPVIVRNSPS